MNCAEIEELFSAYYDNTLTETEKQSCNEHLLTCEACTKKYQSFRAMLDDIHGIPIITPPDGFHEEIMRRLHTQPVSFKQVLARFLHRPQPFAWAAAGVCACFILISVLVAGISSIVDATGNHDKFAIIDNAEIYGGGITYEAADTGGVLQLTASASPLTDSYFQQTFSIEVTADDFEGAVRSIEQLNGYNVNANVYYSEYTGSNSGYYVRCIDAEAYESVKYALRSLGKVTSESEMAVRLSARISDLQAQLTAKEQETRRLMELLSKSLTIDVLTAVERRLGYVEDERDRLRGQLNGLYDDTAHPRININLQETPPPPTIIMEPSFSERLGERFIGSVNATARFMENFIVWLASALIPLIVIAAIVIIIVVASKRSSRKRRERNDEHA